MTVTAQQPVLTLAARAYVTLRTSHVLPFVKAKAPSALPHPRKLPWLIVTPVSTLSTLTPPAPVKHMVTFSVSFAMIRLLVSMAE